MDWKGNIPDVPVLQTKSPMHNPNDPHQQIIISDLSA